MSNNISKNISFSYLSVILTSIIGFISVPLMINYMGTEIYGIWVFGFSLVSYLMLSNFGIPVAATTLMAKKSSQREKYSIFFNSFLLLAFIAIIFIVIIIAMDFSFSNWVELIGNIDNEHLGIANSILLTMLIGFLVRLPFQLALSAFSAYQKLFLSKIYEASIFILNFTILIISIQLNIDIKIFVLLSIISNFLVNIVAFFHVKKSFLHTDITLLGIADKSEIENIFKHSLSFFYIGIAATIVWATDSLIIANMFTMTDVAIYSVAFKLFTTGFLVFTTISGVMFPLYGKYYAEDNWNKINEVYNLNLSILPAIAGLIWIGGIFFSYDIILLWIGKEELYGGLFLMIALGGYGFVLSIVNTHANLLSGLNLVKNTVKIGWFEAVLNLVLSIILANYFGLAGIALGTVLASILAPFLLLPYYISKNTDKRIVVPVSQLFKIGLLSIFFVFLSVIVTMNIELLAIKIFIFISLTIAYLFLYSKAISKTEYEKIKNIIKNKSLSNV